MLLSVIFATIYSILQREVRFSSVIVHSSKMFVDSRNVGTSWNTK